MSKQLRQGQITTTLGGKMPFDPHDKVQIAENIRWGSAGTSSGNDIESSNQKILEILINVLNKANNPEEPARKIFNNYFLSKEGEQLAVAPFASYLKQENGSQSALTEVATIVNKSKDRVETALSIAGDLAWTYQDPETARDVVKKFIPMDSYRREAALEEIAGVEDALESIADEQEASCQAQTDIGQAAVASSVAA